MTGRYCPPRICWCGNCAWYVPMPEPDYSRLVATAERASEKQRRSWATREETTWMEEL
jgi:hypothetical protein